MHLYSDQNIPHIKDAFEKLPAHLPIKVSFFVGRELTNQELKDKDILLIRSVTKVNQTLLTGTSLKWIASATAGIEHIDLGYLQKIGIPFFHTAGANADSVVEYVLFAIFNYCVNFKKELKNLKIGIVGCGNIGGRLAKVLKSSQIKVVTVDPLLAEKFPGKKYYKSLNAVRDCDIITAHTPLTNSGKYSTKNMFTQNFFSQLTKSILFINTSRGKVVSENILFRSIEKKKIQALVLDVWENEPQINPILFSQCLIGTPHIAGYSQDGKLKSSQMIYEKYCRQNKILPQWDYRDYLKIKNKNITYPAVGHSLNDKSSIEKIFLEILKRIYDFHADHRRLMDVISLNNRQEKIKEFDLLRKTYPCRYEWSNYNVIVKDRQIYQKLNYFKGIISLFNEVRYG